MRQREARALLKGESSCRPRYVSGPWTRRRSSYGARASSSVRPMRARSASRRRPSSSSTGTASCCSMPAWPRRQWPIRAARTASGPSACSCTSRRISKSTGRCSPPATGCPTSAYVVLSHLHFDHAGCAHAFPSAQVVLGDGELAHARSGADKYARSVDVSRVAAGTVVELVADGDLFGDGSVVALRTPGPYTGSSERARAPAGPGLSPHRGCAPRARGTCL